MAPLRYTHLSYDPRAEDPECYRPGGYHPTALDDVLAPNQRYCVVRKLGYGQSSTVWLAKDAREDRYVAVKIGTAAHSTVDEDRVIAAHNAVEASTHPGRDHVQKLLDHFVHVGPNGRHVCFVVEPLGRNMDSFAECERKAKRGMTTKLARAICRQLVMALDCLHMCGLAHRDIQPGNVLLGLIHSLDGMSEEEINADLDLTVPPENDGEEDDEEEEEEEQEGDDISEDDEDEIEDAQETAADIAADAGDLIDVNEDGMGWNSEDDGDEHYDGPLTVMTRVKRRDRQPLTEHEVPFIHASYSLPDGVTGTTPPAAVSLRLCDLGAATSTLHSAPHDLPTYPLGLRSPQVVLQAHPISYQAADVWALGLTLWELVTREQLLRVDNYDDAELTDDSHLESAVERLGPMPAGVRAKWPRADKWVDMEGRLRKPGENEGGYFNGDIRQALESGKPADMTEEEMRLFEDFVVRMLMWEERERATTKELLQHPWLKEVGA